MLFRRASLSLLLLENNDGAPADVVFAGGPRGGNSATDVDSGLTNRAVVGGGLCKGALLACECECELLLDPELSPDGTLGEQLVADRETVRLVVLGPSELDDDEVLPKSELAAVNVRVKY
jgi:hypothetical protein